MHRTQKNLQFCDITRNTFIRESPNPFYFCSCCVRFACLHAQEFYFKIPCKIIIIRIIYIPITGLARIQISVVCYLLTL